MPLEVRSHVASRGGRRLIGELRPDVVAIDSPPRWAATGRSRRTERELAALQHPVVQHAVGGARDAATRSSRGWRWGSRCSGRGRARVPDLRRRRPPKREPWRSSPTRPPWCWPAPAAEGVAKRAWRERRAAGAGGANRRAHLDRPGRRRARRADGAAGARRAGGSRPGDPDGGRDRAAGELAARPRRTGVRPNAPEPPRRRCSTTVRAATRRARSWCAGSSRPGHDAKRKSMLWTRRAREGPRRDRGARPERGLESCPRRCGDDDRANGSRPGRSTRVRSPTRSYGAVNVPIYQTSTYAQDGGRRAEALGLRARREPDARGAPAGARLARGRRARVRVRERHGAPRPRCC